MFVKIIIFSILLLCMLVDGCRINEWIIKLELLKMYVFNFINIFFWIIFCLMYGRGVDF